MTARVCFKTRYCQRMVSWWGTMLNRSVTSTSKPSSKSTLDIKEVEKFTGSEWWGEQFSTLRSMNTVRVPLVRDGLLSVAGVKEKKPLPLEGYKIIDVGCGGGLLSEPLARLGATVTGLDPGQGNINVATEHASRDAEIKDRLNYVCDSVENYSQIASGEYDAVVCSEVIEHVVNRELFVNACVELTKETGSLFFTTINRTLASYLMSIVGGEYILNIIPKGTHEWNKFVPPDELSDMLKSLNCRIVSINGTIFNPLTRTWSWSSSRMNTYTLHAIK